MPGATTPKHILHLFCPPPVALISFLEVLFMVRYLYYYTYVNVSTKEAMSSLKVWSPGCLQNLDHIGVCGMMEDGHSLLGGKKARGQIL